MTRDPGGWRAPGIEAKYDADCPRCSEPILKGKSRIAFHRGAPIHCSCASGADDE